MVLETPQRGVSTKKTTTTWQHVGDERFGDQDHGGDGCRWIESTGWLQETRKAGSRILVRVPWQAQ